MTERIEVFSEGSYLVICLNQKALSYNTRSAHSQPKFFLKYLGLMNETVIELNFEDKHGLLPHWHTQYSTAQQPKQLPDPSTTFCESYQWVHLSPSPCFPLYSLPLSPPFSILKQFFHYSQSFITPSSSLTKKKKNSFSD